MPEISRFLGITIAMFYKEHNPPHFHAYYGSSKIIVEIDSGKVCGKFPRRALLLVLEWWLKHREELLMNWDLAVRKEPLKRIRPLE